MKTKSDIYVGLDSIIHPNILASCLIAYIPVFGKVTISGVDYARLLFALAGVADEDQGETERNPWPWIKEYSFSLSSEINSAEKLSNPYSSALILAQGIDKGFINLIEYEYWHYGWFSLTFDKEYSDLFEKGGQPRKKINWKNFDKFSIPLFKEAEGHRNYFDSKYRSTVTLHTDIFGSYINGLGYSLKTQKPITTCTRGYWNWLKKNSLESTFSKIPDKDVSHLIEFFPERFSVKDIFKFIEDAPVIENLLSAKEEYEAKIKNVKELSKESLVFLMQEIISTIAAPIVTGYELFKMLFRLDFKKWNRKP
jgi:hypothetical protein